MNDNSAKTSPKRGYAFQGEGINAAEFSVSTVVINLPVLIINIAIQVLIIVLLGIVLKGIIG